MSNAVLRVDALHKRFGALAVTSAVSLDVRPGEIHALIGPNGAGKSTLVAQIAGQLAPDSGSIWLNGDNITDWSVQRRAQNGLGRTFQISSVFRSLSALDNVQLALNAKSRHQSLWRSFAGGSSQQAQTQLQRLQIEADPSPAGALGYGTVRQLELAMGLAQAPALLLLDEPLAGLGAGEALQVIAQLKSLRGQLAMLLIEHDMDAVFALADRISVLVEGAIIASGTVDEIRSSACVRQAYLGDD